MKKSLIIGGFCLALLVSGCSTPQAAEPQAAAPAAAAQPDDAARRDADRNRDAQRDKDRARERDQNREASRDAERNRAHATPCPDGEHLYTDRDGKTGCVRN
jgi:hypothetical protein